MRQYSTSKKSMLNKDFAKLTSGADMMKSAVADLSRYDKTAAGSLYADKTRLLEAMERLDVVHLVNTSNYFKNVSGIYNRLVHYLANILTMNWYGYPYMLEEGYDKSVVQKEFRELLSYFDKFSIGTVFNEISFEVIVNGVFYGYLVNNKKGSVGTVLQLPNKYCRSRYKYDGVDTVEFNVKYFDEQYRGDEILKEIILNTFPKEFKNAYAKYISGAIEIDKRDRGAWFLLDMSLSMKFSLTDDDIPFMVATIPPIIELEESQQLDRQKSMQELLKIMIQKMPLDKNNEMVFDLDEAAEMHRNAVLMMSNAIGVDVLTTFADVDTVDLDSSVAATSSSDNLVRAERAVFNEAGISQNLLNTDGNLALEKSISNDEALMFKLLRKYEGKINQWIGNVFQFKYEYKISLPPLTIYNTKAMVEMYKSMASAGYSKILPAVALGQSQSEFLSMNELENNILDLNEKMVPVQISSTQKSDTKTGDSKDGPGAPELPDDEKSEKTIQNKESAN